MAVSIYPISFVFFHALEWVNDNTQFSFIKEIYFCLILAYVQKYEQISLGELRNCPVHIYRSWKCSSQDSAFLLGSMTIEQTNVSRLKFFNEI